MKNLFKKIFKKPSYTEYLVFIAVVLLIIFKIYEKNKTPKKLPPGTIIGVPLDLKGGGAD